MVLTKTAMKSLADTDAITHDHAADHRIGLDMPGASLGQSKSLVHPSSIP